ncbi:hypothetical protein SCD_n01131 [Sulfuricella denitrificans skB26]|uniref:Leucine-binding protein domain-containing protein n=2 Tax=Sulfuricella denitrificans TaxID=649841 RepID=S6A9Z4_SULDS|nr:hypothetical protein SCD_n01131 [Sulfuricella denitrificans skB26]
MERVPSKYLERIVSINRMIIIGEYHMKKTLIATLLLGMFAVPSFAADAIKIAITGPFSGGSAPMGISMRDGAKLAISEINAAGGISVGSKKMKIEIIERDDEGKNERGALIGQELASMGDLSGVIGTVNTGGRARGRQAFAG